MKIKKVYIEKRNNKIEKEEKLVLDYCIEKDIEFDFFCLKNILRKRININKENMVVGTINAVHGSLKQLELQLPEIDDYPREINKFLYRDVLIKKAKDINNFPCFIKPAIRLKKFTGFVAQGKEDLHNFIYVSGNEICYVSNVVNFVSEWRVFVLNEKILDIKPAPSNVDHKLELDLNVIDKSVKLLGRKRIGYAVDFGLLDNGKTALIEVNDGYSLGSYGLDKEKYFSLLSNRWIQLMYL